MMKNFILLIISVFFLIQDVLPQNKDVKYKYNIQELKSIMDSSSINYAIEKSVKNSSNRIDYDVIPSTLEVSLVDGRYGLHLAISRNVDALAYLDTAEQLFTIQKYSESIDYYLESIKYDSLCSTTYVCLGDAYYYQGDILNASKQFLKAIELNFLDYRAHWFLARICKDIKEYSLAVYEISIAHLLNRNNKKIKELLTECRKLNGNNWKEYEYEPVYSIDYDSLKKLVVVVAGEEWLGYALAQAVWEYEPGFAYRILGHKWEKEWIEYQREYSAVYANIDSPIMKEFSQVLEDKRIEDFIWYEIISKKNPTQVYVLTKDEILNLLDYIETYH